MQGPGVKWTGEVEDGGEVRFRLGRDGDRLIAEWPGICTLRSDSDGLRSELVPAPGADPELVDKLHRGLAKALMRHLERKLTLHASAAVIDGVAIACAGESESGKSTTAAKLVAHHGGALLADDTLALEFREDGRVAVRPTETVSWLLPDARVALGLPEAEARKMPVAPKLAASQEFPLAALVILGWGETLEAPEIRRLRGHEALGRIVPSVVRFVLDEPERNREEMEQLVRLTERVPIYELTRPWQLEKLGMVGVTLCALARSHGGVVAGGGVL